MKIDSSVDPFFKQKSIILDNAYDPYVRNRYIEHIAKDDIKSIVFHDNDLSLLKYFPNTEYVQFRSDYENIETLYEFKNLKGISTLSKAPLDFTRFEKLQYLRISPSKAQIVQMSNCKNLKNLSIYNYNQSDLSCFSLMPNLENLIIDNCKIESLCGIENFPNLKNLTIQYCIKLKDISKLKEILNLEDLYLENVYKIEDYNVFYSLTKLKSLFMVRDTYAGFSNISSIGFVKNMPNIENFFISSYKIQDKDLTPLLKVKNADVYPFLKSYNIKESDLHWTDN